ncbi:hypothetical protein A9Q84_00550 [Halobacteriovorax marinus]|uniref:Uncharacterized protein n=1 Tax=Halobacteriovorax marinus TaxID=97084 RepID=A0A1Y5FBF9_9BACT|nr:hypothetical protein A9Q84_00550 [Halobacteriovorax marinus]
MNFLIVFISLLIANGHASKLRPTLKPFETDLCTFFREGTKEEPNLWAHCCVKHDLSYWVAGDKREQKRADVELRNCVEKVASPFWAKLMYRGIRLGHLSPIKNAYHWGWSWGKKRKKYAVLSSEEQVEALINLQNLNDIDPETVQQFIDFRFRQ